jgi:hypothetical protein
VPETGLGHLENPPIVRCEINDVFRPFIEPAERRCLPLAVLAQADVISQPPALTLREYRYDFVFRASRNLFTCRMASENEIEDGCPSSAFFTRPLTPANNVGLGGFWHFL